MPHCTLGRPVPWKKRTRTYDFVLIPIDGISMKCFLSPRTHLYASSIAFIFNWRRVGKLAVLSYPERGRRATPRLMHVTHPLHRNIWWKMFRLNTTRNALMQSNRPSEKIMHKYIISAFLSGRPTVYMRVCVCVTLTELRIWIPTYLIMLPIFPCPAVRNEDTNFCSGSDYYHFQLHWDPSMPNACTKYGLTYRKNEYIQLKKCLYIINVPQ